jgi:Zn-dependent protease
MNYAFSQQTNDNVELLKIWAGTSIAFALFLERGRLSMVLLLVLAVAAVTCGLGIMLHELAHRIVARHYGAEAHVVAHNEWLLVSIVIAFAGIFVAAPGAVWHQGITTRQQGGLVSLAGPVTNLVLAVLFLLLHLTIGFYDFGGLIPPSYPINVWLIGYHINAWLGLFNMIPFGPLDGAKVFNWNKVVFGVTIGVAVLMVFVIPSLIGI